MSGEWNGAWGGETSRWAGPKTRIRTTTIMNW